MKRCMCKCNSGYTAHEIVNQLASDKKLMQELKNINSKEYSEDVIQDIFVQMLTKEPLEKLQLLCKNNQMKFFIIGVLTRQINSKSSPTAKKYTNTYYDNSTYVYTFDELESNSIIDLYELKNQSTEWNTDELNKLVKDELAKLHFYDRQIFEKVVSSNKTFKELEKELKIKDYSIFFTFNKVRKRLQKKIKRQGL